MFTLDLPPWEFAVRAIVVYGVLLVMIRLSGKRTIGQFTPFDLLVVLLLSEAVGSSMVGEDRSLTGGLIVAGVLVALNFGVAWISARNRRVDEALEGAPILLARGGRIFDSVLRRQRVSEADIEKALRCADCRLEELDCAFLEVDGGISIQKRRDGGPHA